MFHEKRVLFLENAEHRQQDRFKTGAMRSKMVSFTPTKVLQSYFIEIPNAEDFTIGLAQTLPYRECATFQVQRLSSLGTAVGL